MVSAVGASRRSLSFYSRVKGEMENGLSRIRLDTVHIVRPSLLLGDRDETSPAEAVGHLIAPPINPVLPLRYRAISADAAAGHFIPILIS